MKRNVLTTNFGEYLVRHTVRIEDEASPKEGHESFRALMTLMQTLCYQPDLLRHGSDCPESVRAYHDGGHWVVESTTVAPRKD